MRHDAGDADVKKLSSENTSSSSHQQMKDKLKTPSSKDSIEVWTEVMSLFSLLLSPAGS